MLASVPSPEAGKRLRVERLRIRLSTRDVEDLSHAIAEEMKSPDYLISHSWLTQIENGKSVPRNIYKLFSLCRIYELRPDQVLAFFGISFGELRKGYMSLNLPRTHLVGPVHEEPGQTMLAPLGLRGAARLEQTNLVSRMFESWGEIPVALLQQVDLRHSVFGYIGLKDYTLYPFIRPGSLVQIDSRQRTIKSGVWPSDLERPIYFIELRDDCVCSWCDLDGNQLLLIPGPQSGQSIRRVRYPMDAEVVGRVTAIVMPLTDKQGV
jgi:transcriptional regulator with XRE-family HTH domain